MEHLPQAKHETNWRKAYESMRPYQSRLLDKELHIARERIHQDTIAMCMSLDPRLFHVEQEYNPIRHVEELKISLTAKLLDDATLAAGKYPISCRIEDEQFHSKAEPQTRWDAFKANNSAIRWLCKWATRATDRPSTNWWVQLLTPKYITKTQNFYNVCIEHYELRPELYVTQSPDHDRLQYTPNHLRGRPPLA